MDTAGDGAFAPDGKGVGTATAAVRAERPGLGHSRPGLVTTSPSLATDVARGQSTQARCRIQPDAAQPAPRRAPADRWTAARRRPHSSSG